MLTNIRVPRAGSDLDIVFCVDTTASMGSYIQEAKKSIIQIISDLTQQQINVRFALVKYRDQHVCDAQPQHHSTTL